MNLASVLNSSGWPKLPAENASCQWISQWISWFTKHKSLLVCGIFISVNQSTLGRLHLIVCKRRKKTIIPPKSYVTAFDFKMLSFFFISQCSFFFTCFIDLIMIFLCTYFLALYLHSLERNFLLWRESKQQRTLSLSIGPG